MVRYTPVRSVERAMAVLEEMNRVKSSTVAQLHLRTKLAKPTIVRLLQTLEHIGYVSRDERQSGYVLTSKVMSLSAGFHNDPLVVEAGRAYAIALTKQVTWPVSIAIPDQGDVVVRFSTIPDSPISPFHATVNMRLSLDLHGLGLAYLAFCPEDEQRILLKSIFERGRSETPQSGDTETGLQGRLALIKQQGFAERLRAAGNESSNTIAVPILGEGRVLGTLGITYFRSAVRRADAVRDFLRPLQDAAKQIASNVRDLT
ncbi:MULTISPECIES: DNA-binding transcriptional regulator [unclassified Phaeobacter]|uniref:DNA-binding transcriptional regulator n=1 Tax=unclassified Phaeobacter TaxID=2621772 RepID=UPI003A8811DC